MQGFNAFTLDDSVDGPCCDSGMSRHIVRYMLWAIFCGLLDNQNGRFNVKYILDMDKAWEKFESSIRNDFEICGSTEKERIYADANQIF